jgi:UDP-N-acetylglucosamine:LPS N-acetylglucosamine transferase
VILESNLSGEILATKIEAYNRNSKTLEEMSLRSAQLGRPEAAKHILFECKELLAVHES